MIFESTVLWDEKELFSEFGRAEQGYMGYAKYIFTESGFGLQVNTFPDYTVEIQSAINSVLRFLQSEDALCVLKSLLNMTVICESHINDHIPYSFNRECWGFRILDEQLIWYLACTPWNERCHFTIYAYRRSILLSCLAQKRGLPLFCSGVYKFTGERIRICFGIREFERYPQYGGDGNANNRYANEMNEKSGINPAQRAAMENGVIYGWETPAAAVENYDEEGKYCPEEKEERAKK